MNNKHPTYPNPTVQEAECIDENQAAQRVKNEAAIQLLRSWRTGDEQEQRETWQYLKRVLDEDRLSNRKLFP